MPERTTRGRQTWRAAPAVAALGLLTTCAPPAPPPSVLVIVIDSLRADHLHHAGDPRPLSPRLDAFAAEAARFTRAFAPAPWTTPSVMSLFTGLHPASHHVNGQRELDGSVATLAERLGEQGYVTGAVMPAMTLADHHGFDRGMDRFVFEVQGHSSVSGPWTVEEAGRFLDEAGDRPFFLYLHFWDVHYNYNPPVPDAIRFQKGRPPTPPETDDITGHVLRGPDQEPLAADRVEWLEGAYAAEVHFTDTQVGRILDRLQRSGRSDDTIVVITADHGESFQEHGLLGHTVQIYDEMVHVPLLVRWPGRVTAGKVLEQPAGLVDLAPTLLDLAGAPGESGPFDGVSLAPLLVEAPAVEGTSTRETPGGPPPAAGDDRTLLLQTSRQARLRGLRGAGHSYLYDLNAGRGELYRHAEDPGQQQDLSGEEPEESRQWHARLCRALALPAGREEFPMVPLDKDLRDRSREALRSLGYAEVPVDEQVDPARARRKMLADLGCSG